ncbi:MAG: hypothetical protein WEB37_03385 [Bacteroidota bacterium]
MNTTRIRHLLPLLLILGSNVVQSQVSVIGELSQDREAKPGETYTGTIVVKNDTNEPQEAKVYQTDYLFYSNGTNSYGEPGSHARSNARWITFGPSYIELPPQALITIQYSVTVPVRKDSLVGTYWSMLMVEGIAKGSPESSRDPQKKADMGIMQTIRYGIQIATHIQGTGERLVEFKNPRVVNSDGGKRTFQVDVENTGTLGIRPEVSLELFNEKGVSVGTLSGVRFRIYPGTSVRQLVDLSSVPAGTYKTMFVVDAGGEEIFGAQYTLRF